MRYFSTGRVLPRFERAGWIIVILAVVTVFLAPSGFGPYSAVNGPTTVFKSIQQADAVKAALSATIPVAIGPPLLMILCVSIATSAASVSGWIGILDKYCVRLC
jgi:hypothetical protein